MTGRRIGERSSSALRELFEELEPVGVVGVAACPGAQPR